MPTYARELLCICFKPEDGRPIIECDNGAEVFLEVVSHRLCRSEAKMIFPVRMVSPPAEVRKYKANSSKCRGTVLVAVNKASVERSPPEALLQSLETSYSPRVSRLQTKQGLVDNVDGKGKAPKYPGGTARERRRTKAISI